MVFMRSYNYNRPAPPSPTPESFEFVGMLARPGEKEGGNTGEDAKYTPFVVPWRNLFEMCHPIGAYNLPW